MDMSGAQEIRTVLADDHELVRAGLTLLLERVPRVRVVGQASSGEELLAVARRERPALVVTDISMPGMNGLAAIGELRALPDPPRILVVSMHDSPDFIRRAMTLGASGYVMKEGSAVELEQAVRRVMGGHTYFSPQVSQKMMQRPDPAPEEVLTERQLEILVLIASGHASKEAAFKLGLSPKTVDVHRARIMERLGIDDVAGLTLYCVRHGLVDPRRAE
ncbi:MAG TPA: response regulator transcription factor [Burkholderiales bacterium]|nr:response regulator transcription factor [Burkholderiales bacterium]